MEITTPKTGKSTISKIQVLSSFAVSLVTTTISVLNKVALRNFPYPSTISLVQGVVVFVGVLIIWLITGKFTQFSFRKARNFIPSGICTAGNFITNFYALNYLNVSTVAVLHNLSLIFVSFTDRYLFGRIFSFPTLLSLVVIIVGAVMYCYGEFQFSIVGYVCMFGHILFHESQSIYVKWITMDDEYSSLEMSFYNSFFSLPLFILNLIRSQEWDQSYPLLFTYSALWPYLSSLVGLLLTNLRFFSIKILSVTGWAALNIVNKIPASLLGVYLFDQKVTYLQIMGYVIAFGGAFLYSFFGQNDKTKKGGKKKGRQKMNAITATLSELVEQIYDGGEIIPPTSSTSTKEQENINIIEQGGGGGKTEEEKE